ncbi:hypothetical protein D9M70_488600 [compost metagenome]
MAGGGHRVSDAVREDHECDLRDLVEDHSGAGHRLRLQPRISADRRARCPREGKADLHVLRLAARRLGWAQRQRRLQRHDRLFRHGTDGSAGGRTGEGKPDPDDRIRSPQGFRRSREMARRCRGAEDFAHARCREHGDLVYLRPRTGDRLGYRGWIAVDPARSDADTRDYRPKGMARRDFLGCGDRARRRLFPSNRRRRWLRRSAGARSEAGAGRCDRRLRLGRAGGQGLWRRDPAHRSGNLRLRDRQGCNRRLTPGDPGGAERLAGGRSGRCFQTVQGRRDRCNGCRPPLCRHPRLGHR